MCRAWCNHRLSTIYGVTLDNVVLYYLWCNYDEIRSGRRPQVAVRHNVFRSAGQSVPYTIILNATEWWQLFWMLRAPRKKTFTAIPA